MPSRTIKEMQDALTKAMSEGKRCDRWIIGEQTLTEVMASGLLAEDAFDPEQRIFWGLPVEIGDPGEGHRVRLECE